MLEFVERLVRVFRVGRRESTSPSDIAQSYEELFHYLRLLFVRRRVIGGAA